MAGGAGKATPSSTSSSGSGGGRLLQPSQSEWDADALAGLYKVRGVACPPGAGKRLGKLVEYLIGAIFGCFLSLSLCLSVCRSPSSFYLSKHCS